MKLHIRKSFLIALIVLLILALTAGILFLIFPQMPAYFRYRDTVVDETMTDYPYTLPEVPADFAERISYGVTIKAPAEHLNPQESRIAPFKSDTLTIGVICTEDSVSMEGPDTESGKQFTEADFRHFYETVGEKAPETQIESIVFVRDKLTAKTCLRLRGTDYEIFELLAESKKIVTDVETPYFYHGSNFDGLICELKGGKTKGTNVLVSDPVHHQYVSVWIRCNDAKLTKQIIAGLDFSGFLAGKTT